MGEPVDIVRLARVPERVHSIEEMFGVVEKLEEMQHIVVLVDDGEGVISMTIDGTTAERINWMLDRAKLMLHGVD